MLRQIAFTVFQAECFLTGNVRPGNSSQVFHILKKKEKREEKKKRLLLYVEGQQFELWQLLGMKL